VNTCPPSVYTIDLLVIGYGNSLRGDDGIGPEVAEAVKRLNLDGVHALSCALLVPELAEPVSLARKVIFVDASADSSEGVRWQKLEPDKSSQLMAHAASPHILLALARDIYGHAPEAWWLTLPVVDMGFHTGLSAKAAQDCRIAVQMICNFHAGKTPESQPMPRCDGVGGQEMRIVRPSRAGL
jgi:hydrogenase maturation protease